MIIRFDRLHGLGTVIIFATLLAMPASALTLTEAQKLLAGDGTPGDRFGLSVAMDGDTAIVGAPFDDERGVLSGSAYVFTRTAGVWTEQAKLVATDTASDDRFGFAVAIDGDTVVVGAYKARNASFARSGAAYVFRRASGVWTQQAKLLASDTTSGNYFGIAVAVNGDTTIIGDIQDDDLGSNSGSAYAFVRSAGVWTEEAKLTAADGASNDQFGFVVTVDGDTAAIGAPYDDSFGSDAGAAYVFTRTAGLWTQEAELSPVDAAANDYFGFSLDLDGDTALVSSEADDDKGSNSGSAYIFERAGNYWTQQAKLLSSDTAARAAGDYFGQSVALDGDTAVVSAYGDDDGVVSRGSAFAFRRGIGDWSTVDKLIASDAAPDDELGYFNKAVAVSGSTVLAGAYLRDDLGADSGAVYVFSLGGPATVANAGPDQTVDEGTLIVQLDGSASTGAVSFSWTQVAGVPVTLIPNGMVASPTFDAPFVPDNTTLTFQLAVDDGSGSWIFGLDSVDIEIVDTNLPPVASAGYDSTIKAGAAAMLDGSGSFDPEGDTLGYTWSQTSGPVVTLQPNAMVPNPTFVAPLGVGTVLSFVLLVDDGKEVSSPDEVVVEVVDNSAPVAYAGPDQTADEGTLVELDASGSADPDGGDTLSYTWSGPAPLSDRSSPRPSFTAPLVGPGGEALVFTVIVTDDDPVNPKSSQSEVTVNVLNVTDPPNCSLATASCAASIRDGGCTLWAPNHKLHLVEIVGITDADSPDGELSVRIIGVTQDEPVSGSGDGDTSPDAVIGHGTSADSLLVRAERSGNGDGRVYVVSFTADDGSEVCSGSVAIDVPHDRKSIPVDSGQTFDATQP